MQAWARRLGLLITVIPTVTMWAIPPSAGAGSNLVKAAKEAGYPAQNCLYCHTEKLPKKDTFKRDQLNARGKFMAAEKDRAKAKDIDINWLKAYPGPKEQ